MIKPLFLKLMPVVAISLSMSSMALAQQATVSAGGDGSNGNASIHYTVGQTIQETVVSTDGSLVQGIQFYFSSGSLKIIDLENNLEVSTYPNPTSSTLNIKIDGVVGPELLYELYTLQGQMVLKEKMQGNTSEIYIKHLPAATYLLKIHNPAQNTTKSFKIIKT